MKKIEVYLSKQIHSSFASYSSNDIMLYKKVKKIPDTGVKSLFRMRRAGIIIVNTPDDETFCNRALRQRKFLDGFSNTPEFHELVAKYINDGWSEIPEHVKIAEREYFDRADKLRSLRRKKQGYVLWMDYKERVPANYVGGFSFQLMASQHLKDYIEHGGVFGFIGHSVRKFELDAYIEKEFMNLPMPSGIEAKDILGTWLTSTDGRHFGDSLEDLSFTEQKVEILRYLPEMYNLGFIYSRPEHAGSWKSTQELKVKYSAMLMPKDGASKMAFEYGAQPSVL